MKEFKSRIDIDSARELVEHAINDYLRSKGWVHTSATPGSYWLWQRKLDDGRIMLVDRETAIRCTDYLESHKYAPNEIMPEVEE